MRLKVLMNEEENETAVLIFDAASSEPVELDLRGTVEDVLQRLAKAETARSNNAPVPRAPGRPRLGVVAREVTLLPRHWEWLRAQPGGASVACASWWNMPVAAITTGSVGHRRFVTGLCRPWPAICPDLRRPRERCSRWMSKASRR